MNDLSESSSDPETAATEKGVDLSRRSACPVACALDILGDKWTLIVIRDLLLGKRTYGELQSGPEAIPSNLLAERLKRLIQADIVEKQPYGSSGKRYTYHLTAKGADLWPVLRELIRWGDRHLEGIQLPERVRQAIDP